MPTAMLTVPKYIQEILSRSTFCFEPDAVPGYTISIRKRTEYAFASTLAADARKLCTWADRYTPKGLTRPRVVRVPERTHYVQQYATVTIFDPVMRQIENFINENQS